MQEKTESKRSNPSKCIFETVTNEFSNVSVTSFCWNKIFFFPLKEKFLPIEKSFLLPTCSIAHFISLFLVIDCY